MIRWERGTGPGPVSYRATLGPGLELAVWFEGIERVPTGEPNYNVSVFGKRLKARSASAEDGQRRALKHAETILATALHKVQGQ